MSKEPEMWQAALYDIVNTIVEERNAIDGMDLSEDRIERSRALFKFAQEFSVLLCGPRVLTEAYGLAADDDRSTILHALEQRLRLLQPTFASVEGKDRGSLATAIDEAFAVRAGDAPVLFARLSGKRLVKHREHLGNWDALELEAYAEGLGISLSERRRIICEQFGNMPWDTIAGWKDKAPQNTSNGRLRKPIALMRAKRRGEKDRSSVTITIWEQMVRESARRWSAARRSEI